MRSVVVAVAAFLIVAPAICAQSQTSERLAFEVASIKLTKFEPGLLGVQFLPGGRVKALQSPLPLLISAAYGMSMEQLEWPKELAPVLEGFYNIDAKAPASAASAGAPDREMHRKFELMLQSLLADRFKLRVHREQKDLPVFDLLVARNGPKLQRAAADRDCTEAPSAPRRCHGLAGGPASGLVGKTVSMADLAADLSGWVRRQVIDRTGIQGEFDIELPPWSPGTQVAPQAPDDGRERAADPSSPSIFAALQEQLGLRLESSKGRVDVLVIDAVERPTAD